MSANSARRWPGQDIRGVMSFPPVLARAKGRVVAGVTDSEGGPVGVIAVCIPWRDAHVRSGPRQDATVWEEHMECCTQLLALRQEFAPGISTVIAGDFNQRIPKARQPARVEAALNAALAGMTVWTRGETTCGQLIDHIAASDDLAGERVEPWQGHDDHGRLSDHAGVACTLHRI